MIRIQYVLILWFGFTSVFAQSLGSDPVQISHAAWTHIQSIPYQYTDLRVGGRTVIRGLPHRENNLNLRVLSLDEIRNLTFRHYSTPSGIAVIRAQRALIAGPVAYVSSPYIYTDLTGVFLTDPTATQAEVGLDASIHSAHVDFKIDPRLLVIKIERGIYLIPGPTETQSWMVHSVQTAKVGDPYYDEKLKRDQVGYHALVVPISF